MRDLERTNKGAYSSSINRKNRLQLSATQTISETLGSINLSASTQDYWNKSGRDTSISWVTPMRSSGSILTSTPAVPAI